MIPPLRLKTQLSEYRVYTVFNRLINVFHCIPCSLQKSLHVYNTVGALIGTHEARRYNTCTKGFLSRALAAHTHCNSVECRPISSAADLASA
jgi:hypothetical protein